MANEFEYNSRLLVKRIAGVPGDAVNIGGEILTVPAGCYLALGDNAEVSVDSRYWDEPFVPQGNIFVKLWLAR